MLPIIENQTNRLIYIAEKRDGSGVVSSGTDVHLKVHNITDDAYWTGSDWGAETELDGTHLTNGYWYYDFATPDGDAGDRIEWVWYNETDGTVVLGEEAEVFDADALLIQALAALNNLSQAEANAAADTALTDYGPPTKAEMDSGLAAIDTLIDRVLGLTQENFYIDTVVTDGSGRMTSGRMRTYSVAGSVGTASDVLATYTITATYTGSETAPTTYKVAKV